MEKNYFGITDTGRVRDNNEDTFIAEKTSGDQYIIACVIDGVGGYSGGEIAADIARKSILQHLNEPSGDLISLMRRAIVDADGRIMLEKQTVKAHENMACVITLALIDLNRNQFYYAHVGDTRLYLLRDNSLVKISKDQSFVGFMEDSGRITEDQAMRHPKRNEINKALGFGVNLTAQDDYIETGQSPFLPGDMLLLCSDGLSDMLNKQDITNILVKETLLEKKGDELIAAANKNGGLDNITVVLVTNNNPALKQEALKPATVTHSKVSPVSTFEKVSAPKSNETPIIENHTIPVPVKSGKGTGLMILGTLCFLLVCACIYLIWLNNKNVNQEKQEKLSPFKNPRNAQEKRLQDTLNNLKGNTLILTDSLFQSPITISEPLQLNRDTLFIIAKNNLVFKSDTLFKGKAIEIQTACKYIFLENLTFEDFNTVISSQNNALLFKNVSFINSPNAIESIYHFPLKKHISGKIPNSSFKTDSLPTTSND
ncbi:PP2C family protein-serine/threonine phosphatase [Pedobacter psychroterrae]|uniref:Serine/threonine-protein phosphatase n=1 Tax=Pedobacter psychroterrae TaxID=2530453 RepID=A0A4R0NS04_9SPHI|nr:protein phosphatase 2C domain-containing protein [Pedobacter psychroterrae]TCD03921.1 serine/threonine-protein phosphatase [Pedobacter psychroterrae]